MVAGTAQTFCIFGSWRIGKDTGQRFNFCGGLLYLFQAHLKHCRTLMSQPSPGRRGLLGFAGSPPLVNFDRTHPSPSPALVPPWLRARRAIFPTPSTTCRMLLALIASSVIPPAFNSSAAFLKSGSGNTLRG